MNLYPFFIRLLAQILVQAALIPATHPSLHYGEKDVAKVGFSKLMGHAWFHLRTNRSTPYQWSLFSAAVMMVTTMVAAFGSFVARVLLGVGEVAQAQIFLFSTPNDPYGKGAGVTDINTAVQPITGLPTGAMFDMRVQGGGISSDYALMMLDKILRQAAANTPNGGGVQNALAGLMQVYNTGMLVVAAIMIGWMVMSVIIDTAKTGVVGGGRHNMVWTPIRIIFALGLMFPLGSAGFSSGQYMIMKLAEYGSNFGTRGWAAYVTGVIGNETLLAPFAANNATSLVSGITKLMVCQVAYNTYLQQVGGGTDPSYVIDTNYVIERKQEADPNKSGVMNRYTNNTGSNICGSVYYTVNTTSDDGKAFVKYDPGTTPMTASTTPTSTDNVYKNVDLATAVDKFRDIMRNALAADLTDTQAGNYGSGGTVIELARGFACQFVARRYADGGDTGANPVNLIPQCKGAVAATPTADPSAPQSAMLAELVKSLQTAYEGTGKTALTNYIGTGGASPMVTEMSKRGWAGMGMWYQDIASLNAATHGAKEPTATYTPGTMWSGSNDGGMERCSGESPIGETCKRSDLEVKTTAILSDYDRWWAASSRPGAPGVTSEAVTSTSQQVNPTSNSDVKGFKDWLKNMSVGDNSSFISMVVNLVFPRNSLVFSSVDVAATNTYPLATLTDTGHYVLGLGASIWVGVAILQTVTSASSWGFSLNAGFASSAFVNLLATIATSMIMGGMAIAFYLPVLPFLRVAMAVMTWMTAVFEAVVMLPVAALMHLNTTGAGFVGNARSVWILWFEVLLRPILVVIGFVGGMVIYNSFAVFFHTEFTQGAVAVMQSQTFGFTALLARLAYTVIYLGTLYAAANTSFKLLDIMPNAVMRWLGSGGARPHDNTNHAGQLFAATRVMSQLQPRFTPRIVDESEFDAANPNSPAARAALLSSKDTSGFADSQRAQMNIDREATMKSMNKADKAMFEKMTDRDQRRFVAHKFLENENKKFKRFGGSRSHGYSLTGREKGAAMTAGAILGRQIGRGDRGFNAAREKFRHLDDPNLAVGNMAGVAVGDKLLDNLLAHKANRTHTSNMDMMSSEQREMVRRKIESQMSSADAVAYVGMSDEEQAELIEDMYATDPEMFAPGVGEEQVNAVVGGMTREERRAALSRMSEFMDYGELERVSGLVADSPADAAKAATNWQFMTKDEKADAASKFTSWENRYTNEALNGMNKDARDKYDTLSSEDKATFRELSYLKKNLSDIGSDSVEVINKALSERFGV
ncbi:MAG: DotA/TraY family protein [Micavibrio sp.]|nr:DotA/TraY family protein [Micavibrio sp.]